MVIDLVGEVLAIAHLAVYILGLRCIRLVVPLPHTRALVSSFATMESFFFFCVHVGTNTNTVGMVVGDWPGLAERVGRARVLITVGRIGLCSHPRRSAAGRFN